MVLRVSAPGKPTRLVDLGPAVGVRHPWDLMRRTIDDSPKGHVGVNHASKTR